MTGMGGQYHRNIQGRILSGRRGKESLYNLFTEQVEVLVKIQRLGFTL